MKTQYVCEICNRVFSNKEYAEFCENSKLPESKFKVGDKISFTTRYDGIESDLVSEVIIDQRYNWSNPERVADKYKQKYLDPKYPPHKYFYRTKNDHRLSKDYNDDTILDEDELIDSSLN